MRKRKTDRRVPFKSGNGTLKKGGMESIIVSENHQIGCRATLDAAIPGSNSREASCRSGIYNSWVPIAFDNITRVGILVVIDDQQTKGLVSLS
jgi:hypothetical protein